MLANAIRTAPLGSTALTEGLLHLARRELRPDAIQAGITALQRQHGVRKADVVDAFLDLRCSDVSRWSALHEGIAQWSPNSVVTRAAVKERRMLMAYTAGSERVNDVENRAHVERLLEYTNWDVIQNILTHRQMMRIRLGILRSDIGKRADLVYGENSDFRNLFSSIHPIKEIPAVKDLADGYGNFLGLDGIVEWLRLYQRETGVALELLPGNENKVAANIWEKQKVWGLNDFKVGGKFGGPISANDRLQALRFYKIIFDDISVYWPAGFYFHEIPGFVMGYVEGDDPEVLFTVFSHNPPETVLEDAEKDVPKRDLAWWGSDQVKVIKGPMPNGIAGLKESLVHLPIDRYDQGMLEVRDGDLQGGLRKIVLQQIKLGDSPAYALKDILSSCPVGSEGQINSLWYDCVRSTEYEDEFRDLFEKTRAGLRATVGIVKLLNVEKSEDEGGCHIYLADGTLLYTFQSVKTQKLSSPDLNKPDRRYRSTITDESLFKEEVIEFFRLLAPYVLEAV